MVIYFAEKKKDRRYRVAVLGYTGEKVHLTRPGTGDMFTLPMNRFNEEYRFVGLYQ